jgi:dTDP-4-dehydrorhamnose reductase
MLRVGATNPTLRVVDDQQGSPTSAADLATALATITMRLVEDPAAPTGTYHFSNAGAVTWAGVAREIFAQSAVRGGASADVEGIPTSEYPTPATRPANSLLNHEAIKRDYAIHPPAWQTALGNILDELLGAPKKDNSQ